MKSTKYGWKIQTNWKGLLVKTNDFDIISNFIFKKSITIRAKIKSVSKYNPTIVIEHPFENPIREVK